MNSAKLLASVCFLFYNFMLIYVKYNPIYLIINPNINAKLLNAT